MSDITIATGTPVVIVHDNRGLAARVLNWNRNDSTASLHLLVSQMQADDVSRVTTHRDPRLFAAWAADSLDQANLRTTPSLAGQLLRRDSTDSGKEVMLFDAAGRPVWTQDGRGTVQTVAYDELGRPASSSEQLSGSDEVRVSGRSEYGDVGPADDGSQGNNLRGVCVTHYDDGGILVVNAVALSGSVADVAQRFLVSAEALPNWPEDEAERETLLEDNIYTTTTTADARGAMLNQTNAASHVQGWRYDVSGNICYQNVTPSGSEKQILLDNIIWSAAGQVLVESAGNGAVTEYSYDPKNQWLASITTKRTDKTLLQALSYGYDFTGNVTSISDGTVAVGYYRNQTTSGERQFTYDALYQLLSATGRENANNTGMQYGSLPGVVADGSQYVSYTRSYYYDDSGNLATLTHTGAANFTRTMTTESTSNRSVQQNDGGPQTPDAVADWFDGSGNLLTLQASASGTDGLAWDGSNNLQSVTLVSRSSGDSDREVYQYSGSQRVRKQTRTLVNGDTGLWDVDEVRYLTGLELRKSWQETADGDSPPSEELHVITGQAGRAGIRVLHWETGKPDDIENDQVRWSVDDNIGSLALELDAAGQLISREEYYPFGGTAVWAARSEVEASYKTVRYSGKERDGSGLYYYGHRYYAPWLCRWISADPAGEVDGLNLFLMVKNNPVTLMDRNGEYSIKDIAITAIKTADKYLTRKTSKFLIKRGVTSEGVKRWNRARRTLTLGIAVGGLVAGVAASFGAPLAVIGGIFAAGAVAGGAVAWFANKISDSFAGWMAKRAAGKSIAVQTLAAAAVATQSAVSHNASNIGGAVSATAGMVSGAIGAIVDSTEAAMAAANAGGSAVGTIDTLAGGQARLPAQAGAAIGGNIAGWVLGTTKGSGEVGEAAGIGAFAGGNFGREVDIWISRQTQSVGFNFALNVALPLVSSSIANTVSGFWQAARRVIPQTLMDKIANFLAKRTAGGHAEFAGAALGATAVGIHHAMDIHTGGETSRLTQAVSTAWQETTFSRFRTAFGNYFMGSGGRSAGTLG